MSSCRCHCFRASARSSAKRGDRLHRQFVIPWSGYRGQENAAPLSLERERMRGISLFDIRARVIIGPVTLNPFLPFRNAFSYDVSFRIPFNFLETRMFRVRRGVLWRIEKIQIRKQRSGNVRDGKGWKEADPKQGFGGNPRPHG